MPILKFLGRGSAYNTDEGNTSAYYIEDNTLWLFDCGFNIFERIKNSNVLKGITKAHVLITHLHSDHVGSLAVFIHYCNEHNITVSVCFPNETVEEFLRLQGVINLVHYYHFGSSPYMSKTNYKRLIAHHDDIIDCFSYLFNVGDKTIFYSGDSNCIPDKVLCALESDELDELYLDTRYIHIKNGPHLSLATLTSLIEEKYRSKIYCMHIDDNRLIEEAKSLGFNVVENEISSNLIKTSNVF